MHTPYRCYSFFMNRLKIHICPHMLCLFLVVILLPLPQAAIAQGPEPTNTPGPSLSPSVVPRPGVATPTTTPSASTTPQVGAQGASIILQGSGNVLWEITGRNNQATYITDVGLSSPVFKDMVQDVNDIYGYHGGETVGLTGDLGYFPSGQSLQFFLHTGATEASRVWLHSDTSINCSVTILGTDHWRLDWEDGGGPGIDLIVEIHRSMAGNTYDDFDYAHVLAEPPISGLSNQFLDTDTKGATVAPDDPDMGCGAGVNSNTVWFKLVPTHRGTIEVRTFSELDPAGDSDYDTVIAVFTGQRGSLNWIACNDDSCDDRVQSLVTFQVQPGTTYYIEVADYGAAGGGILSMFYRYSGVELDSADVAVASVSWTPDPPTSMNRNSHLSVLLTNYGDLPYVANAGNCDLGVEMQISQTGESWAYRWRLDSCPSVSVGGQHPVVVDPFIFTRTDIDRIEVTFYHPGPDSNASNDSMATSVGIQGPADSGWTCLSLLVDVVFYYAHLRGVDADFLVATMVRFNIALATIVDYMDRSRPDMAWDTAIVFMVKTAIQGGAQLTPAKWIVGFGVKLYNLATHSEGCSTFLLNRIWALVFRAREEGIPVNALTVESPVYPMVINSSGQRAGFLDDGSIVAEIPDAESAQGAGEGKIVFFPGDDIQSIVVNGSGTAAAGVGAQQSTFTMRFAIGKPDGTVHDVEYDNIPIEPDSVGTIDVTGSSYVLHMDDNGDGTPDRAVRPDRVSLVLGGGMVYLPVVIGSGRVAPPSQVPAAPSNMQATPLDSSRIRVTWTDNSDNEQGFVINNGGTDLATVGPGATLYVVQGLSPGTYQCHQVRASNSGGNSAWSAGWGCATTPSVPSGPTLTATPSSGTVQTVFRVDGSGFTPSESVQTWVVRPDGGTTTGPTLTADSQGRFTISDIQVSGYLGNNPDIWTWHAQGGQSQEEVTTDIAITG